jgi:hypothetical protein
MRSDMMKVLCERPCRSDWSPDKKGIVGVFRRAKIKVEETKKILVG